MRAAALAPLRSCFVDASKHAVKALSALIPFGGCQSVDMAVAMKTYCFLVAVALVVESQRPTGIIGVKLYLHIA